MVLSICRRLGSGRSLWHRVGLRSANCLVDCRRNGGSECPCNWPQTRGHSSYTRRFFVEGLTAAFEAGELRFIADLTSTRQRHCRLVKPRRRRRPHLMKSPAIVTLASSFLAICGRCGPDSVVRKFSRKLIFFLPNPSRTRLPLPGSNAFVRIIFGLLSHVTDDKYATPARSVSLWVPGCPISHESMTDLCSPRPVSDAVTSAHGFGIVRNG